MNRSWLLWQKSNQVRTRRTATRNTSWVSMTAYRCTVGSASASTVDNVFSSFVIGHSGHANSWLKQMLRPSVYEGLHGHLNLSIWFTQSIGIVPAEFCAIISEILRKAFADSLAIFANSARCFGRSTMPYYS